jgi:hypothetical protein
MANRKPYPSDISNEEWGLRSSVSGTRSRGCPQCNHDLREVLNGF